MHLSTLLGLVHSAQPWSNCPTEVNGKIFSIFNRSRFRAAISAFENSSCKAEQDFILFAEKLPRYMVDTCPSCHKGVSHTNWTNSDMQKLSKTRQIPLKEYSAVFNLQWQLLYSKCSFCLQALKWILIVNSLRASSLSLTDAILLFQNANNFDRS